MINAQLVVPLLTLKPLSTRQFRDIPRIASVATAGCEKAARREIARLDGGIPRSFGSAS
jgi:hypothetical protein